MTQPFLPNRAWFRFQASPSEPKQLGLLLSGVWHRLEPVLGNLAFDPIACLAKEKLWGRGLDSLTKELGPHTMMERPQSFLLPIPHPSKILCLGKNYAAHAREFGTEAPKEPMFFNKLPECLMAEKGTIQLPHDLGRIDHEGELVFVIGKPGHCIPEKEAHHHIAGWTIGNDITARDLQKKDRERGWPWVRAKSIDGFGPVGPWVVPFEDLFDGTAPQDATPDLAIAVRVNGETHQESRTSLLVHRIHRVLAELSRYTTLRPGDLIFTGTPEGVSPLEPGMQVEVEIEKIGVLRNTISANNLQR
jgi:2-keto-4-pentenoate hydratase/2-oxohepta-3-ene-1,7-dioic acid hydratase in catechol pathway